MGSTYSQSKLFSPAGPADHVKHKVAGSDLRGDGDSSPLCSKASLSIPAFPAPLASMLVSMCADTVLSLHPPLDPAQLMESLLLSCNSFLLVKIEHEFSFNFGSTDVGMIRYTRTE